MSETKAPYAITPTGPYTRMEQRAAVCSVEGVARQDSETSRTPVYKPESGAIGANPGNLSPGPEKAPRIEKSGQGDVVRGWMLYDDRGKRIMAAPCERIETAWEAAAVALEVPAVSLQIVGATMRPVLILPAPDDLTDLKPAELYPESAALLLQALAVKTADNARLTEEVERLKAPTAERCPTCKGEGGYRSRLEAMRHHPDWKTATCPDCHGSGYTPQGRIVATPLEREVERLKTQVLQRDAEIARLTTKIESLRRVLEMSGLDSVGEGDS